MINIKKYKCSLMISALVGYLVSAGTAAAQDRVSIRLPYTYKGYETGKVNIEGLRVSIGVQNTNVNGGKIELCAYFYNDYQSLWEGGYRLTDRDVYSTFATVKVAPNSWSKRCEIIPVTAVYNVVVNRYD